MQISQKSWHYRFNKFVQGYSFSDRALRGQFTTCSYIRTLIFSMISGTTKAVVVAVVGILAAVCLLSAIIVPILVWFTNVQPDEGFVGIAVFIWAIAALILAILTARYSWLRMKERNKTKPPKEPNLFIQAIKDKHDKFCTHVKVKCE